MEDKRYQVCLACNTAKVPYYLFKSLSGATVCSPECLDKFIMRTAVIVEQDNRQRPSRCMNCNRLLADKVAHLASFPIAGIQFTNFCSRHCAVEHIKSYIKSANKTVYRLPITSREFATLTNEFDDRGFWQNLALFEQQAIDVVTAKGYYLTEPIDESAGKITLLEQYVFKFVDFCRSI